jgi:hypothetical protein
MRKTLRTTIIEKRGFDLFSVVVVCIFGIHLCGCADKQAAKFSKSAIEGAWRVDVCVRVDNSNIDEAIEKIYKLVVVPGEHGGYVVEDVGHSFIDVDVKVIDDSGIKIDDRSSPIFRSDDGWFFAVRNEGEAEELVAIHATRSEQGQYALGYMLECSRCP